MKPELNPLIESLKPCPFCGGESEMVENPDNFEVLCSGTCYAVLKTGYTEDEAIKAWNTRDTAEVERLRTALEHYADKQTWGNCPLAGTGEHPYARHYIADWEPDAKPSNGYDIARAALEEAGGKDAVV